MVASALLLQVLVQPPQGEMPTNQYTYMLMKMQSILFKNTSLLEGKIYLHNCEDQERC